MTYIQTITPRVRIPAPAVVDRFTAAHHDQDAMRENMAAAVPKVFRPQLTAHGDKSLFISKKALAAGARNRLAIMTELATGTKSSAWLARELNINPSSVRDHLRKFEELGHVIITREANHAIFATITANGRKALKEGKA